MTIISQMLQKYNPKTITEEVMLTKESLLDLWSSDFFKKVTQDIKVE